MLVRHGAYTIGFGAHFPDMPFVRVRIENNHSAHHPIHACTRARPGTFTARQALPPVRAPENGP